MPGCGRLPQGHQWAGGAGGRSAGAGSIFRTAVRVLQPQARQGQDSLLGAQRLLPVAKAPGEGALQVAAQG